MMSLSPSLSTSGTRVECPGCTAHEAIARAALDAKTWADERLALVVGLAHKRLHRSKRDTDTWLTCPYLPCRAARTGSIA